MMVNNKKKGYKNYKAKKVRRKGLGMIKNFERVQKKLAKKI